MAPERSSIVARVWFHLLFGCRLIHAPPDVEVRCRAGLVIHIAGVVLEFVLYRFEERAKMPKSVEIAYGYCTVAYACNLLLSIMRWCALANSWSICMPVSSSACTSQVHSAELGLCSSLDDSRKTVNIAVG